MAVSYFTFVATYRFGFKSDFQSCRLDPKKIVHKFDSKLRVV